MEQGAYKPRSRGAKVRMGDDDKVDGEVGCQFASRWCHAQ